MYMLHLYICICYISVYEYFFATHVISLTTDICRICICHMSHTLYGTPLYMCMLLPYTCTCYTSIYVYVMCYIFYMLHHGHVSYMYILCVTYVICYTSIHVYVVHYISYILHVYIFSCYTSIYVYVIWYMSYKLHHGYLSRMYVLYVSYIYMQIDAFVIYVCVSRHIWYSTLTHTQIQMSAHN